MCFSGIPVTWHHASKLKSSKDKILRDPGMRYGVSDTIAIVQVEFVMCRRLFQISFLDECTYF